MLSGRPWTVELPLWIPGFRGDFAYGDVSIEGEDGVSPEYPIEPPIEPPPGGDFGKIISRLFTKEWYLKFFFLTRITYEKDRFLVQLDGLTGSVGSSVEFNYNNTKIVEASFRTTNLRLFAGYKFIDLYSKNREFKYELFAYLGARAYFQNIYSSLGEELISFEIHPTWVEPIIGIQNQFSFNKWFIVLQSDYGGLFVDSKYSLQFSSFVYYRTGKITSIKLGWNHLFLKQNGEFLKENYSVNVTLSGPSVALVFHF